MRALDVPSVIAGEAVSGSTEERWADMVAIASVIHNRAQQLGVPPQDVIANQNEFNIYGQRMPPGTTGLVDMANEAMAYVEENGPVHRATFYATPAAVDNLPNGLSFETETTGHRYFSDPQNRAIYTASGLQTPNSFAYATNPQNVPTPGVRPSDDALGGWTEMAAAPPVQSPMGSVQAKGLFAGTAPLEASATARPMMDLTATADIGTTPGMQAGTSVRGMPDPASVSSRIGLAEPGFDMSRFDGNAPTVAEGFDHGRFGPAPVASIDPSRFGQPQIDVATNTQSFMETPQVPAALGNFPDAMAAQRGPTRGLFSAEMQARQGEVERQLQNPARLAPMTGLKTAYAEEPAQAPAESAIAQQMPSLSVPASGHLAGNAPLEANATVPSIPGAMTPAQIGAYQQMAASAPNITNLSGTTAIFDDGSGYPVATQQVAQAQDVQQNVEAAPALDTISVPDQPSIAADIEGPATMPANVQQQRTAAKQVTPAATQTSAKRGFWDSLMSPQTAIGATVGSLALGPVGGLFGALAGQQVAQNPGLFSGGEPMAINNIGSGSDAVFSVWSGGQPPGTQATASDGQQVTSLSGGRVAITGKTGAVTVFDSSGKAMGYFGSDLGGDTDQDAEGGGLFG